MMVAPKKSKAFIKRMGELRAKRETNFRKSVKENMDNFGNEYLVRSKCRYS